MALQRRNTVTRLDAQVVAGISLLSAIVAAFSDAAPTGDTAIDAVLVGIAAAVITWLSSTSPWWALFAGAGLVTAGSLTGPVLITACAVGALIAAGWIGWTGSSMSILRAVIGGVVVQVAFRLEWNPFFLSSALVGFAAIAVIAVTGLLRRKRYVRRRVYWALMGTTAVVILATAAMGFASYQTRITAQDGYSGMLEGLDELQAGRTLEASETLRQVAVDLGEAGDHLSGPLTQPARFVPGVAQNRNAAADVIASAASAAASAADALAVVDLDGLTVSGGEIDTEALTDLEQPLAELNATVDELQAVLHDAESPWLVGPFQTRLARVTARADQVAHQAAATAATARVAPAMLGADGPRRYLIAFVNTAESRGQGGLMGNWSEITIDDGEVSVTGNGRSAELQTDSLEKLNLDVSDDYIVRYGDYGAANADDGTPFRDGVRPKFWSNVTLPADMPNAASPMAQMYEQATGRAVDGVFVIDPVGLGALVDVIGSIDVVVPGEEEDDDPIIERRFSGDELRDFLLLDQYEIEEAEREVVLEQITAAVVESLFSDELPPPQQLAAELSDAALNGHITAWAERPEEQELLALVGMDGALPTPTVSGMDALAVVSNNASGNKIENFLERTIEYRPIVDQRTGEVTATLTITMTNTAPTRGYTDYVIGNLVDAPIGTNRMLLDVYTQLDVDAARLDGDDIEINITPELGYSVFRNLLDIPPGETVVVELDLSGDIGPGAYQLAYRPQSLPNTDQLSVDATTPAGNEIFSFEGELERRSVINASGVQAWRPADAN